jgi:hypothetical protein
MAPRGKAASVSTSVNDLIYTGPDLQMRAMNAPDGTLPAKAWVQSLDVTNRARLEAVCRLVESRLLTGRSLVGLVRGLPGSTAGLFQLLLTLPGYRGTHPSLVYWPAGLLFWAVAGAPTTRLLATQTKFLDTFAVNWMWRTNHGKTQSN